MPMNIVKNRLLYAIHLYLIILSLIKEQFTMPSTSSTDNCTHVTPECPIDAHLYGYAPNLAANIFFVAFFVLGTVFHLVAGIYYRTWSFMVALTFGCLCEAVGYVGRVMMHYNVWDNAGFQVQITCLILGPSILAAGVYLTLKHIVLNVDQRFSRLKANWYTWIFIFCDLASLNVQGGGGGVAGGAENGSSDLKRGTDIMIGGIIFQVVVLVFFGYFLIEYFVRVYRHHDQLGPDSLANLRSRRFQGFMGAVVLSFSTIFARCVYRIPELIGGWGNELMKNETEFIILEGVMICLATLSLTVFHPGWCFPAMAGWTREKKAEGKTHPLVYNARHRRLNEV